jgi:hypothetical protein
MRHRLAARLSAALGLVLALHPTGAALANGVVPPEPAVPSRSIELTCPAGEVPAAGFDDVGASNVHGRSIDCLRHRGLTEGVAGNRYAPGDGVSRAQMATFVARLIEESGGALPAAPADAFTDDDESVHETNIDKLAALGVVSGTGEGTFDPNALVTRGQMASLMVRAVEHRLDLVLDAGEGVPFSDVEGHTHEPSIVKAARAGVVSGRGDDRFDPDATVARDQVASFAVRALDLVVSRPSWERAVLLIHACQVKSGAQGHDLSLVLNLKDGSSHATTQPYLDAVFDELAEANCPEPAEFVSQ